MVIYCTVTRHAIPYDKNFFFFFFFQVAIEMYPSHLSDYTDEGSFDDPRIDVDYLEAFDTNLYNTNSKYMWRQQLIRLSSQLALSYSRH